MDCNFLRELATLTGGTPAVPPKVLPTMEVEALRGRPAKPMESPRVGSIPAPLSAASLYKTREARRFLLTPPIGLHITFH